jgi:FAD:protein FMN transferase
MRTLYLKRFLISFFVVLTLTSCQQAHRQHHDTFLVFGTIVNVTLLNVNDNAATEAFRHIREELNIMHRIWHVWEPGSLMRINMLLPHTKEFSAAPSVLELVHVAKKLAIQSQHLFNPAIGKLIALWGFHSHKQPEITPSDEAIQKLVKQNPTLENITINGVRLNNNNPAVKIDLGGIAKGYAIDRLLKYLKQQGIHNALIDTGGDLKVIGKHFDRAWKVAIRDPRTDPKKKNTLVATLELQDNEAAFTSGDYERYFKNKKNNDRHLHHIIDPRTGYPAMGTQSVTVLHNNAATADAAATALFIAGPTQWIEIAKAMKIKNVLLIDEKGELHISSSMKKRLKLIQKRKIVEQVEL